MTAIRHWITLCEVLTPSDRTIRKASTALLNDIDWTGGEGDIVIYMMGLDPNDETVDTKSRIFRRKLTDWAQDRVWSAFNDIEPMFAGGNSIRVYRMITAPPDWKPDPNRHPGDFWSWDEHAADAHWGHFSNGHVKWIMVADVTANQIDWVATLAKNGLPSQENEQEITLKSNVPVKLISYYRRK